MWKFWRGRQTTKGKQALDTTSAVPEYKPLSQARDEMASQVAIKVRDVVAMKELYPYYNPSLYPLIPTHGSVIGLGAFGTWDVPKQSDKTLWKCLYCLSPNDVSRHHCTQCGAPLELR